VSDGFSFQGGRWLPDPTGRYEFRWHNGTAWTADVSVHGNRFVDPAGAGPAAAGAMAPPAPQPGWPPVAARSPVPGAPGAGMAIASFVLGISSLIIGLLPFVVLLAFAGAVIGLVLGIRVLRTKGDRPPPRAGLATAGVVLSSLAFVTCAIGVALTVQVIRAIKELREAGPHEVSLTRCQQDGRLADVRGTITNLDEVTNSYVVAVELSHGDGVLAVLSVHVDDVTPGGTEPFSTSEFLDEEGSLECRIVEVRGPSLLDTP